MTKCIASHATGAGAAPSGTEIAGADRTRLAHFNATRRRDRAFPLAPGRWNGSRWVLRAVLSKPIERAVPSAAIHDALEP
jgi:hypothetical protein